MLLVWGSHSAPYPIVRENQRVAYERIFRVILGALTPFTTTNNKQRAWTWEVWAIAYLKEEDLQIVDAPQLLPELPRRSLC